MQASKRELVSDWVLQMSLDQNLNQEIDMRPCESCAASIYSANLVCPSCKVVSEPCCVTGFPVLQSSVNCTSCRRPANKDDWNKYVLAERVMLHLTRHVQFAELRKCRFIFQRRSLVSI